MRLFCHVNCLFWQLFGCNKLMSILDMLIIRALWCVSILIADLGGQESEHLSSFISSLFPQKVKYVHMYICVITTAIGRPYIHIHTSMYIYIYIGGSLVNVDHILTFWGDQ